MARLLVLGDVRVWCAVNASCAFLQGDWSRCGNSSVTHSRIVPWVLCVCIQAHWETARSSQGYKLATPQATTTVRWVVTTQCAAAVLRELCFAVAFAGPPEALAQALSLSDLSPRWGFRALPYALTWPMTLARILRLTGALSMTMAVFNALPVFITDGDHITKQLLGLLLPHLAPRRRAIWHNRFLYFGSGLLAITIGCGLVAIAL